MERGGARKASSLENSGQWGHPHVKLKGLWGEHRHSEGPRTDEAKSFNNDTRQNSDNYEHKPSYRTSLIRGRGKGGEKEGQDGSQRGKRTTEILLEQSRPDIRQNGEVGHNQKERPIGWDRQCQDNTLQPRRAGLESDERKGGGKRRRGAPFAGRREREVGEKQHCLCVDGTTKWRGYMGDRGVWVTLPGRQTLMVTCQRGNLQAPKTGTYTIVGACCGRRSR